MALDGLAFKIETNRAKAAELNAGYQQTIERIRNNPTLSARGKQQQIAAAHLDTTAQVAKLQADEQAAIQAKSVDLQRGLLGSSGTDPSHLIAFRDAQDRAERLGGYREAANVLDRALLTSDDTLAAAVLHKALENNWSDVVSTYTTARPEQAERLSDLQEIAQFNGVKNSISNWGAYATLPPSELERMMPEQIAQIATATVNA
ncbi:MAG: hypothetical protein JWN70_4313 [Planctomycetaceae bacterium]|nr:hypothetical protein [Planctomycetaceae bacterium]